MLDMFIRRSPLVSVLSHSLCTVDLIGALLYSHCTLDNGLGRDMGTDMATLGEFAAPKNGKKLPDTIV